jgi:putative PIG3 family NAD(P)H quinone oxidoreductase
MRAITIPAPGGAETLIMTEVPRPTPAPNELLVRVYASGVNRADVLQRLGRYPAPPGAPRDIPGLEFAGEVAALGGPDLGWHSGDRVMGIVAGGGYGEFLGVPAAHALPIPRGLSFEEAAAVPEAFVTAHDALVHRARVRPGEHVLVHAVGSGVGVALLQLAKASGAVVAGSSRTEAKLDRCLEFGLDVPVLVKDIFAPGEELRNWADVICDLVGGAYLPGNLEAAAPRGRIVVIGLTGGRSSEIDLGRLLVKRLTVVGTVLRSRSVEEKTAVSRSFSEVVLPLFETKRVAPVLDRVFPVSAAAAAHRYMESNRNFGSIVLTWQGGYERLPPPHGEG